MHAKDHLHLDFLDFMLIKLLHAAALFYKSHYNEVR